MSKHLYICVIYSVFFPKARQRMIFTFTALGGFPAWGHLTYRVLPGIYNVYALVGPGETSLVGFRPCSTIHGNYSQPHRSCYNHIKS